MKNVRRIIIDLLLVISLCMSTAIPTFASGEEVWSTTGRNYKTICTDLRMYNTNLTPTKTISGIVSSRGDDTGTLSIKCSATRADSTAIPIEVHLQIKNADTNASISDTLVIPEGSTKTISIQVKNGQRIRLYFDICSQYYNPDRNYRAAYITYSYLLM